MIVLEGDKTLGVDAHKFYDEMIRKIEQDVNTFSTCRTLGRHADRGQIPEPDPRSSDGKAAYVQVNLAGNQGSALANEGVGAIRDIIDHLRPRLGVKVYATGRTTKPYSTPCIAAPPTSCWARGLTVASAVACLSFTRLPYFQGLGIPAALGILVALFAALTLGPAILALGAKVGIDPKRAIRTRGWRLVRTAIVCWPGVVPAAASALALVGLITLPGYKTSYDTRPAPVRWSPRRASCSRSPRARSCSAGSRFSARSGPRSASVCC
nr:MMPL family transporter [Mycobacterium tilburgii]